MKSFVKFLFKMSEKNKDFFELNSSIHVESVDNVPIEVKVKYLVNLIKNKYKQKEQSNIL